VSKLTLKDASIHIQGLDHSNYVHSIDLLDETEEIDVTPLGSEYKVTMGGLAQITLDLDMYFGNQPVDQALRDANYNGTELFVQLSPHTPGSGGAGYPSSALFPSAGLFPGASAVDNPGWEGYFVVTHFVGMEGDVGAALGSTVTLKSSG
jgi:hypothetical protein